MYVNFNKHPNVLLRWCCVHCELHKKKKLSTTQ